MKILFFPTQVKEPTLSQNCRCAFAIKWIDFVIVCLYCDPQRQDYLNKGVLFDRMDHDITRLS